MKGIKKTHKFPTLNCTFSPINNENICIQIVLQQSLFHIQGPLCQSIIIEAVYNKVVGAAHRVGAEAFDTAQLKGSAG